MKPSFLTAAEAVARFIEPGASLGVGGMHLTAAPMAVVDEVVRRQIPIGRLITGPSASIQADLPIAAGLVGELLSPYVGFEHLGLAPAFRRAVESGQLDVLECDEGSMTHALYAGAGGLPFIPCPPGVELTDVPSVNPGMYRRTVDPFDGLEKVVVPAVRPDVSVIACLESDHEGNVAFGRFPFTDRLLALAGRRLIVQVERVVEQITPGESLPAFLIAAVVVAPGGCRPTASPGLYPADEEAVRAWLAAARTSDGAQAYIEELS